jgi:hypothetical protein
MQIIYYSNYKIKHEDNVWLIEGIMNAFITLEAAKNFIDTKLNQPLQTQKA